MSRNQSQPMAESEQLTEVFFFPQGLAGFASATRFAFIYEGHGDITCLQSTEDPELAFLLTPWDENRLGPPPELSTEQKQCLQQGQHDEVLWMLVLNPFADRQWVTANLKGPIAINVQKRRGLQCIQIDPKLPLRYPWMRQPKTDHHAEVA